MSAPALEKLVWVLIYGGLLMVGLGLAVQRNDASLGWSMVGIGVIAAAVGAVLVWVRSRMRGGDE
jgi:vacuolar-type H+-ATPase subunit I/STV1